MDGAASVWITGVGAITPIGADFDTIAKNLQSGRCGMKQITSFDTSDHPSKIAAPVEHIPVVAGYSPEVFARFDRLQQAGLYAGTSALKDADIIIDASDTPRTGLIMATATEWLSRWESDSLENPTAVPCRPEQDRESLSAWLQQQLGIPGPSSTISAACASGNFALALARQWLQMGLVDRVLAGACDMAVTPMTMAGFGNLRVLSRRNEDPLTACRPFDVSRDGFVLAEGSVFFVLEREATARKRSAKCYGEILSVGMTSDAYHLVIPDPEAIQAARSIRLALDEAKINFDEIDYLNAHAPGTSVGDAAEAKAIRAVFGYAADRIPVSSTKSITGHLLTAASAIEAVACLATLRDGVIPPTLNLESPDPDCNLLHVPKFAIEKPVNIALSTSFGFGGANSCAIFKRV
jgi:3-oxoacyl-[acyl-carrier-protein] synthase II